jgi:hypothetical protein
MPTWGLNEGYNTRAGVTPPLSGPGSVPVKPMLSGIPRGPQLPATQRAAGTGAPQLGAPAQGRPLQPPVGVEPRPAFGQPSYGPAAPALGSPGLPMPGQQQLPPPPPALGSPGLPMPGQQQLPPPPAPLPRGPVVNDKWRMQQQIGGVTPEARRYGPPAPAPAPVPRQVGGYTFF